MGSGYYVIGHILCTATCTRICHLLLNRSKYRVIKKSLCTWWLRYRKLRVIFKVYPASLQTFIDTPNCVLEDRVQYSKVHIPNVFCLKYYIFACFLYCNCKVNRDFLITLYNYGRLLQNWIWLKIPAHITNIKFNRYPTTTPSHCTFHCTYFMPNDADTGETDAFVSRNDFSKCCSYVKRSAD
jgi:hypothetical protein